jgi:hypothetical protein
MCLLRSLRVASSVVAFSAILVGCGSSSSQAGRVVPGSSLEFNFGATAVHENRQESWMLPEAKKQQSLLYISNQGSGSVTVYTYLNGGGLILVGTLTGFSRPTGMCTDNAGDVWIPDYGTGALYEYAHGGTTPISTIKQHTGLPYDCAVDPLTGSLAVANQHPNAKYGAKGLVDVYPLKGSKGGGSYTYPSGFRNVYFVTYDNKSNLYVDATPCPPSGCGSLKLKQRYLGATQSLYQPGLFELSKGGSFFTWLPISGATLNLPGAINWIKPTLLLGDQDFEGQGTNGAYKLLVSGSTATVVGTLPFKGTQLAYGFWRRAGRVVVPDYTGNIVRIYNLSDGSSVSTLTTEISSPFGAVVSQ